MSLPLLDMGGVAHERASKPSYPTRATSSPAATPPTSTSMSYSRAALLEKPYDPGQLHLIRPSLAGLPAAPGSTRQSSANRAALPW